MGLFYSRAVVLIVSWGLCMSIAMASLYENQVFMLKFPYDTIISFSIGSVFVTIGLVGIANPFFGLLADSFLGNFKTFKTGSIMLFLGLIVFCFLMVVQDELESTFSLLVVSWVTTAGQVVGFAGFCACYITFIPLGFDQMADASTSDLIKYITWFFLTGFGGIWLANASFQVLYKCTDSKIAAKIWTLFPVACICYILCTLFLLAPKWLFIEAQCSNALRHIYRVLKFAAKHKSPLNRGAFTYWEENIPSRLDLGKSRFGGPFTTEQVEDVKTFFKLLVVVAPTYVSFISMMSTNQAVQYSFAPPLLTNVSVCRNTVLSLFTYNHYWCYVIALILYECVYPLIRKKLPSILKRIGALLLLMVIVNITSLCLAIISLANASITVPVWSYIVCDVLVYANAILVMRYLIEFTCAQSPFSMRGIISGLIVFLVIFVIHSAYGVSLLFDRIFCRSEYCLVSQHLVGFFFSLAGFCLHLIAARWYKNRVREEEYSVYQTVADTYEGYVQADPRRVNQGKY